MARARVGTWHAARGELCVGYFTAASLGAGPEHVLLGTHEHALVRAPRLLWNPATGMATAPDSARRIARTAGGAITTRGLYRLLDADSRETLGELDEEFVHESKPGDRFAFGLGVYRVVSIRADAVLVRTPSFFKNLMTSEVYVRHYVAVAEASTNIIMPPRDSENTSHMAASATTPGCSTAPSTDTCRPRSSTVSRLTRENLSTRPSAFCSLASASG